MQIQHLPAYDGIVHDIDGNVRSVNIYEIKLGVSPFQLHKCVVTCRFHYLEHACLLAFDNIGTETVFQRHEIVLAGVVTFMLDATFECVDNCLRRLWVAYEFVQYRSRRRPFEAANLQDLELFTA